MKIFLARHTETNYNTLGLSNADPKVDVFLTDRGIEQAESLAASLRSVPFEVIIVSELKRTRQTADIINRARGIPILSDKRLNDIRMGFEGKPTRDYEAALQAVDDIWNARFHDGESLVDVKDRAADFLRDLKKQAYSSVLVVTHLSVIQQLYALMQGLPLQESSNVEVMQGGYTELSI